MPPCPQDQVARVKWMELDFVKTPKMHRLVAEIQHAENASSTADASTFGNSSPRANPLATGCMAGESAAAQLAGGGGAR